MGPSSMQQPPLPPSPKCPRPCNVQRDGGDNGADSVGGRPPNLCQHRNATASASSEAAVMTVGFNSAALAVQGGGRSACSNSCWPTREHH